MLVYEDEPFTPQYQKSLYYLNETKGKTENVNIQRILNAEDNNQEKFRSLSFLRGTGDEIYGLLCYTGVLKAMYKDGTQAFSATNYPALWNVKDEFYFHKPFGDTIYRVKELKLEPYRIFHLGERRLSADKRGEKEGNEEKLSITYVLETADLLFFQCAQNLYGDVKMYNGLYRKSDETLMMNPTKEGFMDDLTGFLPFHPKTLTSEGGFVGFLKVEDIQEWLEEHPEVKLEGALAPLKDLADDANPVVVIVEP